MRTTIKKKLTHLAIVLIFLGVYYGFLFDILISAKDSLIGVMQHNNITNININVREYNASSGEWYSVPKQIDLTGLIDFILVIVIIFAPIIMIMKVVVW